MNNPLRIVKSVKNRTAFAAFRFIKESFELNILVSPRCRQNSFIRKLANFS
jgi:hypothetical protein